MANAVIFGIFLLLIGSRVESCSLPEYLHVNVPHFVRAGYVITTVDLSQCDAKSMHLTLTDDRFAVTRRGEIVAARAVAVLSSRRTFSVWAEDNAGPRSEMVVHLDCATQGEVTLKRVKRRWGPPPFNILENDKGPFPKYIDTIVSDSSTTHTVFYEISGPGIDEEPANVFSLESETGKFYMLQSIDREQYPVFNMVVQVYDVNTHQETDNPLPIIVEVDDENDNAPTVDGPILCTVAEKSKAGTVVGTVIASDRDQKGTDHVKLRYTLLDGLNMFNIDSQTGVITTATNTLDRETQATYLIPVKIVDMDGRPNGLHTTATATISLSDVNDNPPTFKENSYAVSIQENSKEKLILRIPVDDKDLINTPNWISQFIIKKGNDGGNFRIETDRKTNEGLLYVTNGVDYEKNKIVNLEIMARNEADLTGTTAQWNSIPIKVTVGDVDEGPEFTAPTVRFHVRENTANGTVIGTYTAVDPETKSSNGISYYKVTDPAHWINVDKNTGQLRVANTIDRESKFVHDGIYNITVKAVDASMKTGTGTVIIVVEDVNDNRPTIPPGEKVVCENEDDSVVIVAEDSDLPPFSSPFIFSMPADSDGRWSVTRFNDTAATLTHTKNLPMGIHDVDIDVQDQQSLGGVQTVRVRICECRNGVCLAKQRSVMFGPMGLLALLLPLFLLLLLCLLLCFFCMTKGEKREIDDSGDSGGILLKSNTEAPGEEVDASLITVPTIVDPVTKGSVKGQMVSSGWPGTTLGGQTQADHEFYDSNLVATDTQDYFSGRYDSQYGQHLVSSGVDIDSRYLAQNAGFLHNWQTNGRYLQQKVAVLGSEEDARYADDIIHGYRFEGVGSPAGSVGCCSDYADNNDLNFLNHLGPKFTTLADVCTKK